MKIIASQALLEPSGLPVCDNSKYLNMLSCGIYDLRNTNHKFLCLRPEGICQSYMLHIILSGKAYHSIEGKTYVLNEGQCILYAPGERQHIVHYGQDNPVYIWIHFCGYAAETIVKDLHLSGIHTMKNISASQLKKLILQMIHEKKVNILNEEYKEYLSLSRFLSFLCMISSSIEGGDAEIFSFNKITPAVEYMTSNYATSGLSNKEYAAMCFLSESRFMQIFKKMVGTTPQKYIENKRLEAAKGLLMTSKLRISEIANMVGYHDAYYFSRIFKKVYGISPREFAKRYVTDSMAEK